MTMSYYDPKTDRIEGCVEGSFAWYHELVHRRQYHRGLLDRADRLHVWLLYTVFFGFLPSWWLFGFFGMLLFVGLLFFPHVLLSGFIELEAYVVGTIEWYRKL